MENGNWKLEKGGGKEVKHFQATLRMAASAAFLGSFLESPSASSNHSLSHLGSRIFTSSTVHLDRMLVEAPFVER